MKEPSRVKLVVCLGNPGERYARTRHNAGWMVGDELLRQFGTVDGRFSRTIWQPAEGELFWLETAGRGCLLLKPHTFMNLSGTATAETAGHFRLSPREMLTVCDDLDLPEGRIRLRQRGSSGGHRGLASIIQCLQSEDFPRLRVGIGRPGPGSGTSIVDYVLAPWVSASKEQIPKFASKTESPLKESLESSSKGDAPQVLRLAAHVAELVLKDEWEKASLIAAKA